MTDLTETTAARIPPQALDIERSVLGSMLINGECCDMAAETLTAESFYSTGNQRIFETIAHLAGGSQPVDLITVTEALRKKDWLEAVGSEAYLSELVENVATVANVDYLAKKLEEKRQLRAMIAAGSEMVDRAFHAGADVQKIVDQAEQKIFDIQSKKESALIYTPQDLLPEVLRHIEKAQGVAMGLKTGYAKLDEETTGMHPGDLVICAGRPGMAKTSFGLNVALNVCMRDPDAVVAFFSIEMCRDQIMQRLVAIQAIIEMRRIRSARLTSADKQKIIMAAGAINYAKIVIDDSSDITPMQLRSRMRRIKRKFGRLDLVIIDYLQLLSGSIGRYESRQKEISDVSHALKKTAKEFRIPIFALAQLSRACELRGKDKRPIVSDLRESGEIEQDADLIQLLYRDKVYNAKTERPGVIEVIIGKQRNGPTGTIELGFEEKSMRFDSLVNDVFDDRGNFVGGAHTKAAAEHRDKASACKENDFYSGVKQEDLPF